MVSRAMVMLCNVAANCASDTLNDDLAIIAGNTSGDLLRSQLQRGVHAGGQERLERRVQDEAKQEDQEGKDCCVPQRQLDANPRRAGLPQVFHHDTGSLSWYPAPRMV